MIQTKLLRGSAVLLSIWLAASAAAFCCAAEDIILPVETEENEAFVSGDYKYSKLVDKTDGSWMAVCIEGYTGSEAELVIPAELEGMAVVALGDYAFVSADYLQTVTLPDTLTTLGTYSFADCRNLTAYQVADGNGVFTSRDGVLYTEDESSLVRYPVGTRPTEITIPEGVVTIGNVAFTNCALLERVTFPDTLEYIGISAFSDCDRLSEITLPEGLIEISDFAFNSCTALKQVTLPDSLKAIGSAAFAATAIESIELPDSLLKIGEQAFAETALQEVTIPASVTEIGYSAFGWALDAYGNLYMDSSFTIYGTSGSAAESYASDADGGNRFQFVAVAAETTADDAAGESGSDPETQEDKPSGAVRIIGIAVCCVLLVLVLTVAIVSGKKKPQTEDKSAAEPEKEDPDDDAEAN